MRIEKTRTPGIYKAVDESGRLLSYRVIYKARLSDPLSPSGYRLKSKVKVFDKEQQAIQFKIKTQANLQSGKHVEPTNATIREMLEAWLEEGKKVGVGKHGPWKIQTYLSNKTHVDLHIAPKLGEFKAAKLGKRAIEQAAAGWKEQTSAKNANKILRSLNAAFKFALQNPDEFGVAQNPMVQVKQLPEVRSAKEIAGGMVDHGTDAPEKKDGLLRPIQPNEVYSALELRAIIENANGGMEKPLFMTAMLCGVRHGELNSPRWAMIDLKHGILTVNRSLTQLGKKHGGPRLEEPKTKNAKRQLELVPALVKELREWKIACPPNANDLVFVDAMGRPTNRKANNDALKVCCERAQVKALSMNNLRHSFASQQLIGGTTPLEVSYMMGHSSPAVTQALYCHWAKTEKSDAQVNLANRILTATDENEKKSEGLNPYN